MIEESGVKEENTLSNEDKIDIESSAEEKGGKKVFMNEKAKESYLRYVSYNYFKKKHFDVGKCEKSWKCFQNTPN